MSEVIMTAKLADKSKEGGCNFCTRPATKVWVLRSRDEHRRMVVLLCPECIEELREATNDNG